MRSRGGRGSRARARQGRPSQSPQNPSERAAREAEEEGDGCLQGPRAPGVRGGVQEGPFSPRRPQPRLLQGLPRKVCSFPPSSGSFDLCAPRPSHLMPFLPFIFCSLGAKIPAASAAKAASFDKPKVILPIRLCDCYHPMSDSTPHINPRHTASGPSFLFTKREYK